MLHADVPFLLQGAPSFDALPVGLILPLTALVLVAGMVMLFVSRYKRCPSNRVLVISGRVAGGESARCISGGGAFVWPVIQEYAYLGLEPIQIDIPLKDALSLENIRVAVPSVFTVAVGTEATVRQNAAIRILGLTHDQIKRQAQDIIFGQLRQVIASMRIEEINRDREGFLHRVQTSLEPELCKIGLVLINVNITDLKDDSGYIEAIGQKAAAQAVQQARGDVAEQEKTGEVRVAEAQRERSVSVALAQKDMQIGMQVASREQAVRLAELEKERVVGEQQAAFQRDMAVKEAEQAKRVAVASAEAIAIAGEAESQGRVVATRATLLVKEAEAYQLAETRKREAEAAVQQARGDVAEQEKTGEVRVAENEREKLVLVANAMKEREIGLAQADREKAVRIAELEKERTVGEQLAALEREAQVKEAQRQQAVRIAQLDKEQRVGEQTAAFERDAAVKEAEQKKRIAIASADARAQAGEAESQALVAATQSQLAVKQAEAFQVAETRKREAEAAVAEAAARAQARAAIADAERVEAEQRARLEAPAKAEKARTIVEAEAEAERRRIEAQAEAGAIYAKLEAQARGEYEVLAKRAEALGQLVEKAGGAREAFQLLMVDQIPVLAESAAKAIANIKFDKVVVWEGGNANGAGGTAGFIQNMARSMPPMMDVLRNVAGVELPGFLGTMAQDGGVTVPPGVATPASATAAVTPVAVTPVAAVAPAQRAEG